MSRTKTYTIHWGKDEHAKRYLDFKQSILNAECDVASKVVDVLLKQIPKKQGLDLLEIGPGDGAVSEHMLRLIAKNKKIQSYTAIELSNMLFGILKAHKDEFLKSAKRVTLTKGDANKEFPQKIYDLILSINSAYGLNLHTLKALRKQLSPNGKMAILLGCKTGVIMEPTFVFAHEHPPTSESLRTQLKKAGIPFERLPMETSLLKKSDFIRNGNMTNRARIVIPYVIRGKDYDEKAVVQYLKKKPSKDFGIPGELILIRAA